LGKRRKSRRLAPDCTTISTGIGTAYHLDVASGTLIAARFARVITVMMALMAVVAVVAVVAVMMVMMMAVMLVVAMMLVVLMMSFFCTHVNLLKISFKRCRSLAHETWADAQKVDA
jgi:fatty acid desaturase